MLLNYIRNTSNFLLRNDSGFYMFVAFIFSLIYLATLMPFLGSLSDIILNNLDSSPILINSLICIAVKSVYYNLFMDITCMVMVVRSTLVVHYFRVLPNWVNMWYIVLTPIFFFIAYLILNPLYFSLF